MWTVQCSRLAAVVLEADTSYIMGKGGYGKGWANSSHKGAWRPHQGWHHGKGGWVCQAPPPPPPPSESCAAPLTQLCGGVLASAFQGLCSGVTSAAWSTVQSATGALLNGYTSNDVKKDPVPDPSAASIMACLSGKSNDTSRQQDGGGNGVSDHLVIQLLDMQKEHMKQQSVMQQQLLRLQESRPQSVSSASPGPTSTPAPAEARKGRKPRRGAVQKLRKRQQAIAPTPVTRAAKAVAKATAKAAAKAAAKAPARAALGSKRRKQATE